MTCRSCGVCIWTEKVQWYFQLRRYIRKWSWCLRVARLRWQHGHLIRAALGLEMPTQWISRLVETKIKELSFSVFYLIYVEEISALQLEDCLKWKQYHQDVKRYKRIVRHVLFGKSTPDPRRQRRRISERILFVDVLLKELKLLHC